MNQGDEREDSIKVIELLYTQVKKSWRLRLSSRPRATSPMKASRGFSEPRCGQHDAHLSLTVGKILSQRGMRSILWLPDYGVPLRTFAKLRRGIRRLFDRASGKRFDSTAVSSPEPKA